MKRLFFALICALTPSLAFAHGGHDAGASPFMAGLLHPLGGLDHVLAMIAVGLWAALAGGRALWLWPLSFVGGMLAGGAAGMAGFAPPGVEPTILASIVVLGGATALALRAPLALGAALIAAFGAAHGFAHGAEGPEGPGAVYALGFALSTASLHVIGLGFGMGGARLAGRALVRAGGALTAALGLWLAVG